MRSEVTERHRKLAEQLCRPTDSFVSPPGAMTDARAEAIADTEARLVACVTDHDRRPGGVVSIEKLVASIKSGDYWKAARSSSRYKVETEQ